MEKPQFKVLPSQREKPITMSSVRLQNSSDYPDLLDRFRQARQLAARRGIKSSELVRRLLYAGLLALRDEEPK